MEAPEAIVANSHHHTRLLNTIADLEYVPQAKKQQATYIKDLESQVWALQQNITQLAAKTKKERKEHETLRDSTSRRFAHKLIGKKQEYLAKESKEERCVLRISSVLSSINCETLVSREYVEALEREMTERDNERVTQLLLDEANTVVSQTTFLDGT
jgi:DNA repair protein RadC